MTRKIVKSAGNSVRLSDLPAPGRKIYSPSFDFKALAYRALPQFHNGEPLPAYNSDGSIGSWLSTGYVGATLYIFEQKVTVILKHAEDAESVLADSPIYRFFQYYRPYIKCAQNSNPEQTGYWKRVDKRIWGVFNKQFPIGCDTAPYGFIQAVVYVVGSKRLKPPAGLSDDEKAPLVMLKRSALERTVSTLSGENEFNENRGDPTDLEHGPFIQITRMGAEKSFFPTTGTESGAGYDVNVLTRYENIPQDISAYKDVFLKTVTPWDQTFTLLTADEQMELLRMSDMPRFFISEALKDVFPLPDDILQRAHEEKKKFGLSTTTVRSAVPEPRTRPGAPASAPSDSDFQSALINANGSTNGDEEEDEEEVLGNSVITNIDELFGE